jgi:hypothetical protein
MISLSLSVSHLSRSHSLPGLSLSVRSQEEQNEGGKKNREKEERNKKREK